MDYCDFSGGSRIFKGSDFGNLSRTARVWAYGGTLSICELGRGHN